MKRISDTDGEQHSEISRRRFLELTGVAGGAAAVGAGDGAAALSAETWVSAPETYYVGPADAKPSAPARGTMYFETDTGDRCYHDGDGWRAFGRSSTDRRIVDVVEAGADPTGEVPIDGVLDEQYTGRELFYFPAGTYTMERPFEIAGAERVGFVGQPEATIRAATEFGWSHMLIEAGDPADPVEEVYVGTSRSTSRRRSRTSAGSRPTSAAASTSTTSPSRRASASGWPASCSPPAGRAPSAASTPT